jgi:hypothetical protein
MKYYHGSSQHDLKLDAGRPSRYGFPALFLASNLDLAVQYAWHNADQVVGNSAGYVYEFEMDPIAKVVDFKNEITHNSHFRNLIYRLQSQKHSAVRISNALDYPSVKFKQKHYSDIVIVFDFQLLKDYHRIGTVSL